MKEKGKRFIITQLVKAFLPRSVKSMNGLYIFNETGSTEKAKERTLELHRDLGPFFGFTQALAGLTRIFHK